MDKLLGILIFAALISTTAGMTLYAQAVTMGYQENYYPAFWTFNPNGGSGSVDESNTPDKIMLTGNNDGQSGINTLYTLEIFCKGTISFDWFYDGEPLVPLVSGPQFDPSGFVLNGVLNQLTNNGGAEVQSGSASTNVVPGDIFGFYIFSNDGVFGPGIFTMIDNFEGPSCVVGGSILPVDTTALLLAGIQSSALWLVPLVASAVGIGAFALRKKF